MRIEIKNKINDTANDVYIFNMFELTAVFIAYHKEIKPAGKRNWQITHFWDKYGRNSTIDEPELPEIIKYYALIEVQKLISVKTWAEHKS